jgi:ribonuclease HII
MRRAVDRLMMVCPSRRLCLMIDGLPLPELGLDHQALVDGDALCLSISAAGIIAKTVRDRLMVRLATRYPLYDWSQNKGYGTETHRAAILEFGPTPHHRHSFMPLAQLELPL